MRITIVPKCKNVYSSNAYLLRGDYNALDDVNCLIDTGGCGKIVDEIKKINTGAGKKKIDIIILTHNHFDHTGGVAAIKNLFNSKVLAFSKGQYIDELLKDRQKIKLADKQFEIIHTPGHSNDSICIYCESEKILFSGDTPIVITSKSNSYSIKFIESLKRLSYYKINTIYPGHGKPIINGNHHIKQSLKNIIF